MRHLGAPRTLALATAIAALAFAGSAIAASNSIKLKVPTHPTVGHQYKVKLSGYAARTERLYVFLDFHGCGSNPAIEHARANGDYWSVRGSFHVVSRHWVAHITGTDHACAYLQEPSQPLNAAGGIRAQASQQFKIYP